MNMQYKTDFILKKKYCSLIEEIEIILEIILFESL